ncbi:MAG: glutathione S-transferase [Planctomycetota bacterium]|nr:glutathione S-transferase [Planctomycetota bacterium]
MTDNSKATLYSFRRCPYAIRARMALRVSGQSLIHREVVLSRRPQALYEQSPKGTVPVLVLADGQVIDESWEIIQWALTQSDPHHWWSDLDSELRAEATRLVKQNDGPFKKQLDLYKYSERHPEESRETYRDRGEAILAELDGLLNKHKYLIAEKMTAADIALFPFIRQFAHVDKEWFSSLPYTQLQRWLAEFLESEFFTGVMKKYKEWSPEAERVYFP